MLESLTAIYIEPHQCPSYQSILLTQSVKCPWKIFENWQFWKTQFFWVNHFDFASFPWKSVHIHMVEWMGQDFDVFPGFQKIPCYAQYYVIQCIYRTRTIISRSWLQAALEYKPYTRTEFSEKTSLKTKKWSLKMG